MMKVLLLVIMLLLATAEAQAIERCEKYAQEVRTAHYFYFGVSYPYQYSVAQLQAESLCKTRTLSSDGIGSEGPAQITFRVWRTALEAQGIPEIATIPNHMRAQAYINYDAYKRARGRKLWVMYQIYNGGPLVNKEIAAAGECSWSAAKARCRRKIIRFGDGSTRSACDINYEYSQAIFRLGPQYGNPDKSVYGYW